MNTSKVRSIGQLAYFLRVLGAARGHTELRRTPFGRSSQKISSTHCGE